MECLNFINGAFVEPVTPSTKSMDVLSPSTDAVIGHVAISSAADVELAVTAAKSAFASWSQLTVKARAAIMFRFHALVQKHAEELADIVVLENGSYGPCSI